MSEIREYLRFSSKRLIMDKAVIKGSFVLASGARSNEKFEIDRIEDDSEELQLCVNGLVNCIEANYRAPIFNKGNRYTFDAVGSIANGATRLGKLVSREIGLPHIESYKDNDGKFFFDDDFKEVEDLLVLDDVYTSGTNMEKYQTALPSGINVVGGVTVLNRSHRIWVPQLSNGAPVHSVIREAF